LIKEQIESKRQIKLQSDTISQLQLSNADLTNKLEQQVVIAENISTTSSQSIVEEPTE
jgi:hypothetical protein